MENDIDNLKKVLNAEKQEFLSIMSHELRTPMTGVKGYLSMILEGDAGPISDEVKEFIAAAYVANDRLIRLVEHMMKVAKVQQGEMKFKIGKVNLAQEVALIVSDFQVPAKDKNITLNYQKAEKELLVKGDPDRVREVIVNLVSNAVKFTPEKGQITLSHRENDGWLVTDVTDTGIGISAEKQGALFELFTKGNLTLTGQEKGTGVGLFLAKMLTEAQGGKLWLEKSQEGKGSTFSVAFPKFQ